MSVTFDIPGACGDHVGMRQSNRTMRFESGREPSSARESLERRWREHLAPEPRLATLVTAQGNAREPFHRWLPYRQGFAPGLIRLFFSEMGRELGDGPILDPFSGSGTTIVECARQRRPAIGVEAIPALSFVAAAKFEQRWMELPGVADRDSWEDIADQLRQPLHRAALMIAQARRHTASGALNRSAPPIAKSLAAVGEMLREDLQLPLGVSNESRHCDARVLDHIDDESICGMITSPPYLSRYDYVRTNDPVDVVYNHWFSRGEESIREFQVRSSPRGGGAADSMAHHPAVKEARDVLSAANHPKQAKAVVDYFTDMQAALESAYRVLVPDAPAWFVIGGVRLKDVYIPTDLMIAEMARELGFSVEAIRVARELNPIRRKFGSVGHIAPRESLLVLRKA